MWWRAGIAVWLALAGSGRAAAHGLPAAFTGVATLDADGAPRLLSLTEGLALRDGDGLRFVCPARFGFETRVPLSLGAQPGRAFVMGAEAAFRLRPDGDFEALPDADFDPALVVQLVTLGDDVYALEFGAGGAARILRLDDDGATPQWSEPAGIDALAADGERLWLLKRDAAGDALSLRTLRPGERPEPWGQVPVSLPDAALKLFVAGELVLLRAQSNTERSLHLLSPGAAEQLLSGTRTLRGPVRAGDTVYLVEGLQLRQVHADGPQPLDAPAGLTGLTAAGDRAFVAALGALYALPAGADATPQWTLAGIRPPDALPDATDDAQCRAQWALFRADLGRAGYAPADTPDRGDGWDAGMPGAVDADDADDAGGGCAVMRVGRGADLSALLWVCAGYLSAVARRRLVTTGRGWR